jgi:hypothetical protein
MSTHYHNRTQRAAVRWTLGLLLGLAAMTAARQDTLRLVSSLDPFSGDTLATTAMLFRVVGSLPDPLDTTTTLWADNINYAWVLLRDTVPETLAHDTVSDLELFPLAEGNYTVHVRVNMPGIDSVMVAPAARSFTVMTTRRTFAGAVWHMTTLPRDIAQPQPALLFGPGRFWIYHWLEGAGDLEGNYLNYTSQTMAQGLGYWLKFDAATTITLPAGSARNAVRFDLMLEQGWNQIANPYGFDVLWDDVVYFVYEGGTIPVSIGRSNLADKPKGVWEWDPSVSDYIYRNPRVQPAVMRPWQGYWVYAARPAAVYFPATPYFAMDTTWHAVRAAAAPAGWRMRIGVEQAAARDRYNYFGVAADAGDGQGPEDTQAPPALFKRLALDLGDGLCEDFRPERDFLTWHVSIKDAAGPTTITWDQAQAPPAAWRLYLYDPPTGTWTNMRAADSFAFMAKSAGPDRVLTVIATTRADFAVRQVAPALRVTAVTPHPFAHHAAFSIAVPAAAWAQPLSLRLYSLDGQLVRALLTDNAAQPISWDGKSSAGTALPAGIYTYRLTSGSHAACGRLIKVE